MPKHSSLQQQSFIDLSSRDLQSLRRWHSSLQIQSKHVTESDKSTERQYAVCLER